VNRAAALVMRSWYAPHPTVLSAALRPFAWLFAGIVWLRRFAYRQRWLRRVRLSVPVVVVGNITAGGAGKTPLVAALVDALRVRGFRPGIVSRGYGRRGHEPRGVRANDDASDTGDEPLILAESGAPVWVGRDRAAAAQALLAAHPDVNVIIADDGLQHYALVRDVEIAVIDGERALGNRLLLPAGPLREPESRLASVDAVVRLLSSRHAIAPVGEFSMWHEPQPWQNLVDPARAFDVATLRDPATVAMAGIGRPERFFGALIAEGFTGRTHAFPDHHRFSRNDVAFVGAPAVLMTQKDAVKCRAFADARMWMLPIRAQVDPALVELVVEKLDGSQVARDARVSGHQGAAGPRS